MKLKSFLWFLFYSFEFGRSDVEMFQSALPVVRINEIDYEFRLKERTNLTSEIHPSPTLRPRLLNNTSEDDRDHTKINKLEEKAVPTIASLYYYDKEVVELFKRFLKDSRKSMNVSSQHRNLIERYIEEWDEVISEARKEKRNKSSSPDLGIIDITLPKEIEEAYKLLRISNRVTMELPTILNFSADVAWTEVVLEAQQAEIDSGKFFLYRHSMKLSYGMLKMNEMYFTHPWELFPKDIVAKIPTKDLVSMFFAGISEELLIESIKWLSFANNVSTREFAAESGFAGESSRVKGGLGSDPQNGKESPSETPSDWKNSKIHFGHNYLSLLTSIFHSRHDALLQKGIFESYDETLFPKPLSKLGVVEQSEIYALRNHRPGKLSYQNLCNGHYQRDPLETATLKCRYDHLNAPWLYLMPAKVEVLLEDPQILFFHHALTDNKIRGLQQLALILLEEASTISMDGKDSQKDTHIRDSHLSFLPNLLTPEITDTNRIAGYLTGLETMQQRDGERLQVNVYRAGGHYVQHIDGFGTKLMEERNLNEKAFMQNGDRMATLMFYLSDVKRGGKTAFTELGFSVTPEKGGAVLWFSLSNDGEIDSRSKHAGCPVLSGIKWVTNKWIHYNSQLFKRPCFAK